MFKIQVSERIVEHCKRQIQLYNFGQRRTANGTPEQQLTGIIGQCAIMEKFGLDLIDGADGCDDGQDINFKGLVVDVKTMGRTVDVRPDFVNNFISLQLRFNTDLYIFCSLNKRNNELTICGWIPKSEFLQKANLYPEGTIRTRTDGSTFKTFADLYEIKNRDLYDVNSFEELTKSIEDHYHKSGAEGSQH